MQKEKGGLLPSSGDQTGVRQVLNAQLARWLFANQCLICCVADHNHEPASSSMPLQLLLVNPTPTCESFADNLSENEEPLNHFNF